MEEEEAVTSGSSTKKARKLRSFAAGTASYQSKGRITMATTRRAWMVRDTLKVALLRAVVFGRSATTRLWKGKGGSRLMDLAWATLRRRLCGTQLW